nr:helix-turn-helix domain-containing protein [Sedimentibacter sp.]
MKNFNDKVHQIINTFYKTTGIGIMCFDTKLNITAYYPSKSLINDFICLGMSKITYFLTEEFSSSTVEKNIFYTFFLESNLSCNVTFLYNDRGYVGAFVTQPALVNKLNSYEMEKLLDNLNLSSENRKTVRSILLRTPVVAYDKIMPTGYVLNSLLSTVFSEGTPKQVLKGGADVNAGYEAKFTVVKPPKGRDLRQEEIIRHGTYSDYLMIKESIQKGDTEALLSYINEINAGSVTMDQLQNSSFVRSLKNNLIKVCAMSCYAAIEANAPYYKTLDIADEIIRKMETLENINDIYEYMKNTMVYFTREVVSSRKKSYSKPVRLVIEYIEAHYAEKITLDILAKHTNLSSPYLSKMIKKETGVSLMDNINRIRVEQSKKLLLSTNLSSYEVASRVGFSYQNHFASTFKKFTGFAPTDFRKPVCVNNESKSGKNSEDEFYSVIFEQLRDNVSIFDGIYDIVRIVDPIKHISWIAADNYDNILPGTCYDFWGRNESCKNCISNMAYLENDTFLKIDQKDENVFFVLATPKIVENNTYVIEFLKNVSENVYIDIDKDDFKFKLPNDDREIAFSRDELTGLYSRQYIDENLPVCFRRSKLEKKPLSIILSFIDSYDTMNSQDYYSIRDIALSEYARMILGYLENHEDWAGLYAGNVFLTVLNNTNYEDARRVAEKIESKFMDVLSRIDKNDVRISLKYSVKTSTDDVHDSESLIKLASMDLHDNMNYYKRFHNKL